MAIKHTYEYVKKYIEDKGYTLLSKSYVNSKTLLSISCDKGHVFNMGFNTFQQGHRCPTCSTKRRSDARKLSYDYVKSYIESIGYKLISTEYANCNGNLDMICDKGHNISMAFGNLQSGHFCKVCSDISIHENQRHSLEYIREYVTSQGYNLLSNEYVNNASELIFECNCGNVFSRSFKSFTRNSDCPVCKKSSMSIGEIEVCRVLRKYKIKYYSQYKFNGCKFKRRLPFDFYIPEYNLCIEFDGRQHYDIVEYFGGLDAFIDTKIRDTIKNVYCKNNNIKLIRIPYWDFFNVEKIIRDMMNL